MNYEKFNVHVLNNDQNSSREVTKQPHNLNLIAPALYMPFWLAKIPINLLSHAAKITYARLCQFSNSDGIVCQSSFQLSQAIGAPPSSVEKYLKELKGVGLIGSFYPSPGALNHYEFYEHPWMYAEELSQEEGA